MKNDYGNKFLFTIAVLLLACLVCMVFIKIFIFDKKKEDRPKEVSEDVIKEIYSYLDVTPLNNEITFYANQFIKSNNLSYQTLAKVTYNYIVNYDKFKLEATTDEDQKLIDKGTLIYKIKTEKFIEETSKIFENPALTLNEHFNTFDINEETSAKVINDYVYIYKLNDKINNNYITYRGMLSYTLTDNNDTIIITEYYLGCDKETRKCYDTFGIQNTPNSITYNENLDASTMTPKLKKYEHTFKKIDGNYKWVSVEGV